MSLEATAWWISDAIAVFMTIAAISYFFKRTIFFRICESTFVGVATGWMLALAVRNIVDMAITPLARNLSLLVPILLGLAYYSRLTKRYFWLSRFPVSVLVGVSLGVSVYGAVSGNLTIQLINLIQPLNNKLWEVNLGNALMFIMTLGTLYYFFWFAKSRTGGLQIIKQNLLRIGRWSMFFAMGAGYCGNMLVCHYDVLYERMYSIMAFFHLVPYW